MACCKVPADQSWLSRAAQRRLNEWRGVVCSRLFAWSPRAAGFVYRSFGLCAAAALGVVPALILLIALAAR